MIKFIEDRNKYCGPCDVCDTEIKLGEDHETVDLDRQRDGDFVSVKCPWCGSGVFVIVGNLNGKQA